MDFLLQKTEVLNVSPMEKLQPPPSNASKTSKTDVVMGLGKLL